MGTRQNRIHRLVGSLRERAKELNCLYEIDELLKDYKRDLRSVFGDITDAITKGWQYPNLCRARIIYLGQHYQSPDFVSSKWKLSAYIEVQEKKVGDLEVYYTEETPLDKRGYFLPEEEHLLITIARRIGDFIQHKEMRRIIDDVERVESGNVDKKTKEWRLIIEMFQHMDSDLFVRITHKMLNFLCWNGINEANEVLKRISSDELSDEFTSGGENQPQKKNDLNLLAFSSEIFDIADKHIHDADLLTNVQKWVQEDRASFLIKTLVNLDSTLSDIADALRRFIHLVPTGIRLSDSTLKGVRVSLVRQIVSEQLDYISIAKNYAEIEDFQDLMKRLIYPVGSHGLIGGKSAGVFLAWLIIKKHMSDDDDLNGIRVPKTWCITSDGLHNFMHHNNLEEITEQKYKDIAQIRQEYPNVIRLFKDSQFTPEIIQGLSMALDDFGEKPIIVRSSSLLEDSFGAAFSGKYKSLFLANQGTKKERLKALMDAIAEVYSSTFGSDPIEYRAERGLIDFKEAMGIIIQEVVGTKVGKYFLPAYAGVAFSRNEFRWSPRIKREDGLVRMVPGLGTRAVDRIGDDYPILIAPGQPGLRVNITTDEFIRYSPNHMDVINLEENSFETVDLREFIRQNGDEYPEIMQLISVIKDGSIRQPSIIDTDFEKDEIVVTFEGLISNTKFVKLMSRILKLLEGALNNPVDIEFASDGKHFYLLQCRPQSYGEDYIPAKIPKDIPVNAIVFKANKHVSNGSVPDITHIVYVDPKTYNDVDDISVLKEVGRAISHLNKLLPKRQFILIGPGRWGSRGDIKLGVNVTYSDINNTAMLIEVAYKKGNYVPDLSFGTHFFQDLVEATIRYLPLYPDDVGSIFNEKFLNASQNIISNILPKYSSLKDIIRVIDVPSVTDGKVLRVFMNADLDQAVGLLSTATGTTEPQSLPKKYSTHQTTNEHWRWRMNMAKRIALEIDPDRFGILAYYIFGSVKNGTARFDSDIDIMIHFNGTPQQRGNLIQWLEGWSLCLDEMNYQRTGYRSGGLLDAHIISDEDIQKKGEYASKIDAITDPAMKIPLSR
ncbi:nucleotidyltransferase domain-containing protein [bacterium]|nr:nucleotidyltransferase domain-containing protein [bacterium]